MGTKLSALAYNDCAFVDPVYGCYWRRPIHRPGVPGVTVTMPDDDVWGDANTYKDTYVPGHDNAVLFQPTFEGSTGYEHPAGKWVDDNDHRQPKYKPGDKRQVALPPAGPPYLPFDAQAAACEECNKPVNFIHVITHECLEGDALRCVIKAVRDDVPLELDDYVRAGDLLAYFQAGVQQVPPGSGQTQPEGEGPALAPGLEFPPGLELPPGFGLPPQVPGAGPDPSTVYTTHYNTEKPCPWCEVTTRTFVSSIAAPTSDTDVITITATPDSGPPFTTTIALPPAEPTPDFPQILPPPPPQPPAENPTVITITATPAGGATTITTTYTLPPVETPAIPPVIPQPAPPADLTITSKTTLGSTILPIETTIPIRPDSSIVVTLDSVTVPIVSYATTTIIPSNAAGQTLAPPDTATSATLVPPTSTVRAPPGGWPFQIPDFSTVYPVPVSTSPADGNIFPGVGAGAQPQGEPYYPYPYPYPFVQGPVEVPSQSLSLNPGYPIATAVFGGPFAGGVVSSPASSPSSSAGPLPTEIVLGGNAASPVYPPFVVPAQPQATDAVARLIFESGGKGRGRVPDRVVPPSDKRADGDVEGKVDGDEGDEEEHALQKRRTPDSLVRPYASQHLEHISLHPGQTLNPHSKLVQLLRSIRHHSSQSPHSPLNLEPRDLASPQLRLAPGAAPVPHVGQVTGRFAVRGEHTLGVFEGWKSAQKGVAVGGFVGLLMFVVGIVGGVGWWIGRRRRGRV